MVSRTHLLSVGALSLCLALTTTGPLLAQVAPADADETDEAAEAEAGAEATEDEEEPAVSDAASAVQAVPPGIPVPPPAQPIRQFASSEEHYQYLLDAAHGGDTHTRESVPDWSGLWSAGGNNMFNLFIVDGTMAAAMAPAGAVVRSGVLTPEYEEAFRARRAEMEQWGEQPYDRLTHCEFPGLARWFWEPYVREFVNTPDQVWMLNDLMNETRRIYVGADQVHQNVDGTHSATGDSIGFWHGDQLVVHTVDVLPADYLRGAPLTSNQLETVEVWEKRLHPNGLERIEVMVTYYDPWALVRPVTATYTYNPRPDLEQAGLRIRNWECATTSNSYLDADGNTAYLLPGDPGYQDARGTTAFPELPGQTRDPENENEEGFIDEVSGDGMPALDGGPAGEEGAEAAPQ